MFVQHTLIELCWRAVCVVSDVSSIGKRRGEQGVGIVELIVAPTQLLNLLVG